MTTATPIRLHTHPISGHGHRVELMLSLLSLPVEKVVVNVLAGEHKQPRFLALNTFGQVPVIEDGDVTLADSNAILVYLASRYAAHTPWLPKEPVAQAHVQRWLSVAAGQLSSGPGAARLDVLFGRPRDHRPHAIAAQLFAVMEGVLQQQDYLVGAEPTIADIAMYTYTAHAPEGGLSLAEWPAIRAWHARIEALPGFVGMHRSPDAPPLPAA